MKRETIVNILKKFKFVKWDRFFGMNTAPTFFGWIDREDNKKDFMLIDFSVNPIWFATSSKKYSSKIAEILNQDHSECNRVENYCDLENVIRLDVKEVKQGEVKNNE